ncbi:hypothetical protein FGO68_gene15628 [Halteria grandinella]|uniref:Enoyl reductase (ER) domain-containing protein n=1 Tax=Halteria grandinella TaxID=5974 RepID=A0A8J8NML5_HALGN|nr:hypothetical protein FGO68_gene15628 [Halteria grandinella]
MKAVVYTAPKEYSYAPDLKEIPVPAKGQVLIKVECGVINPTDTYFLSGQYNGTYAYPLVPGLEGSGTVIASGGGLMAWSLVGKRVAFTRINERPAQYTQGGSYAEYCVTNAMLCIKLDDAVSFEQGANGVINPLTAIGILDTVQQKKARAVIQTGGNSQMGRMLIRLFRENNIASISIVRKDDQLQQLKDKFAGDNTFFLNSESPDFKKDLKALAKTLQATVALECVAGPMTGHISDCLPPLSTIIQYGQLSEQKMEGINPMQVIAKGLKVEGFLLGNWSATQKARELVEEVIVNKAFGLHQIHEAMAEYKANMGKGKVLIKPSLTE